MISVDAYMIKRMAANGKRLDGRPLDAFREVTVEKNAITTAEGSARVRIGNTEVIAGVKMAVGEPFADTPDEGVLMVGTELLPLASPEFESGPPGPEAVELSRVVDRAIRESKCLDTKALCITPKEKVWIVSIDIDVLDDDGNLIDAASLAAIAALQCTRLPLLDAEGAVRYGELSDKGLPLTCTPLSVTVARMGDALLVDTTGVETEAIDARLTVGTFVDNGATKLCSMQKGGTGGLLAEEVDEMVRIASSKAGELRKLLAA